MLDRMPELPPAVPPPGLRERILERARERPQDHAAIEASRALRAVAAALLFAAGLVLPLLPGGVGEHRQSDQFVSRIRIAAGAVSGLLADRTRRKT